MSPDFYVRPFAESNGLSFSKIPSKQVEIISLFLHPYCCFAQELDGNNLEKSRNPVDSILLHIFNRLYDTTSSMLVLSAVQRLQAAEILSRSVMESAVTFIYILRDKEKRCIKYFKSYIEQEKRQNEQWLAAAKKKGGAWLADAVARTGEKANYLASSQEAILTYASSLGLNYEELAKLPNTIDILIALDREMEYRTIFMAMCSQAHQDAEDIINQFLIDLVSESKDQSQYEVSVNREKHNFSIFLLLHGVSYFLQALSAFSLACSMSAVSKMSDKCLALVENMNFELCKSGFANHPLNGWLHADKI